MKGAEFQRVFYAPIIILNYFTIKKSICQTLLFHERQILYNFLFKFQKVEKIVFKRKVFPFLIYYL